MQPFYRKVSILYETTLPPKPAPRRQPLGRSTRGSPPATFSIGPHPRPTLHPGPEKLALWAEDSPITVSWKCRLASPASLTATQE